MFQYMMHLRKGFKNIDLVFGGCYHYGLEVPYQEMIINPNLSVIDATDLSTAACNKLWSIEGAAQWPDQDLIFPKSPGHAANMFNKYWKRFLKMDQEKQCVIAVEKPFSIDLSFKFPGLPAYIGRIDLIWEGLKNAISIWDHKTAKALYAIGMTSYTMAYQTDGYLTAGNLFFDRIPGMVYNIHLCQKSKIDFHRYYINKRKFAIEQFLQDLVIYVKELMDQITLFEHELETKTDRNDFIESFRRRPGTACTAYMRTCPYFDLCKMRNNPLLWNNAPPQGFSCHEWDPDDHEADMRKKLSEVS